MPPLRISLIKTPSEEGETQPTLYSPVNSIRKSKRSNDGGRLNTSAKKEDIRRITRF